MSQNCLMAQKRRTLSTSQHCLKLLRIPRNSIPQYRLDGTSLMVKDMFADAYISGKNNHSLRATGTTQMYNHGLREKTLKIRTGHKSINGLRAYERPGLEQQREPLLMLLTNKAKRAVGLMLTSVVEYSCTNHSPSHFPSCAFCEFCMVSLMSSLGQS